MKATVLINDKWYKIPEKYALALNKGDYIQIKDDGNELIEGYVLDKSIFIGNKQIIINCGDKDDL